MLKKLLCMVAALLTGICVLCACKNIDYLYDFDDGSQLQGVTAGTKGTLHTVAATREHGFLSESEVKKIAYFYNPENNATYPVALDKGVEDAIKRTYAETWNNDRHTTYDMAAEDVTITKFLGYYGRFCAVTLNSALWNQSTDIPDRWEETYGIKFHVTNYDSLVVWEML